MASESFVEFDYQDDADGVRRHSILFDLEPETFFLTDQTLDYTVTAVKPVARDNQTSLCAFGWAPLIADDAKVLNGEPLNIIQHPNGEPKQLALRANDLIDTLEQYLHCHTDTACGSSGSPVFNDEWEVVALHHSGVPNRDEQGQILKCGGGQWLPEMGEQWIDWIANEGVRISRLLPHLQQQAQLTNQAATLQKELVAANHGTAQDASLIRQPLPPNEGNPSASTLPQNGTQQAPPASVTVTGTVATWTIPLQLSVQF